MCIHCLYVYVKCLAYMPHLVNIFVSGTYLALPGEIEVAVGFVFPYIYNKGVSTDPCCMLSM